MIIHHYAATTGCLSGYGETDQNPLDAEAPLLPAYATPNPPPATAERECARYLDRDGSPPAHYADGEWVIHPDWRRVPLWSTVDGSVVAITEPNVTPEQNSATVMQYPGPGYLWRNEMWLADPALQLQMTEQAAEHELARRQAEASAEIYRIQPAVDGGYAKPEDVELLPKLQRYLYELPDVREQAGWPTSISWPEIPQ